MILETRSKDGIKTKWCGVVHAGILSTKPNHLYIQRRYKRNNKEFVREHFIPLAVIERWSIRKAVRGDG